jgi:hypothetical protein
METMMVLVIAMPAADGGAVVGKGVEAGTGVESGIVVGTVETLREAVGLSLGDALGSTDGEAVGLSFGDALAGEGATGQYSCLGFPRSLCEEERDQNALVSECSFNIISNSKPAFTYEDGPASTLAIDKDRERTTIICECNCIKVKNVFIEFIDANDIELDCSWDICTVGD